MTHSSIPSLRSLAGVWAALLVLTVLTAAVSYVDLHEWNVVVALGIAALKASLVVWIFMGVRHATTLTRLFCVAGLIWLGILILISASDYHTRSWTYQPQPWSEGR